MQQGETQVIYWAPSRVRFNLTLILAVAVILFGVYQLVFTGGGGDGATNESQSATGSEQTQPAAGEEQQSSGRSGGGGSWLLIVVGLGVGAYSWLTGPRQYRVYSDALVIMYGTPRSRQIHFSQLREVVNDRGFMGDPLRVYTSNRRRIPIQVREPEEFHRYLQSALDEFRRNFPEYAPQPEDGEGESGQSASSAQVVDSTTWEPPSETEDADASADQPDPPYSGPSSEPEGRPRRRSLRDDGRNDGYDSNADDARPPFG
jgi:hypothetical protein